MWSVYFHRAATGQRTMLARKDAEKERLSLIPCGSDDGETGDEVKGKTRDAEEDSVCRYSHSAEFTRGNLRLAPSSFQARRSASRSSFPCWPERPINSYARQACTRIDIHRHARPTTCHRRCSSSSSATTAIILCCTCCRACHFMGEPSFFPTTRRQKPYQNWPDPPRYRPHNHPFVPPPPPPLPPCAPVVRRRCMGFEPPPFNTSCSGILSSARVSAGAHIVKLRRLRAVANSLLQPHTTCCR